MALVKGSGKEKGSHQEIVFANKTFKKLVEADKTLLTESQQDPDTEQLNPKQIEDEDEVLVKSMQI